MNDTGDGSCRLILTAALAMSRQCWEQGMLSYALLRCGCDELASLTVHDMILRQSADGRLCNVENTPALTDSSFCIPAVWAFGKRGDTHALAAAQRNIDFLLCNAGHAEDGKLFHMRDTEEIWADSASFLPYSLAITGHTREALLQMRGILERLYLPEWGLYAHIWDERSNSWADPRPWGVGNGWILTGLLRTALALHSGDITFCAVADTGAHVAAAKLCAEFERLLNRMLAFRTASDGFTDVLNDPASFEEAETSAMVSVCIYTGIHAGLLPRALFPAAEAIRAALLARMAENGLIQGASSSPGFDRPGTSVECQVHSLLMEHRRAELLRSSDVLPASL